MQPIVLSLKLASVTTAVLLVIGVPLAFGLVRLRGVIRAVLDTLVTLPLVLPPTVLGFYMLVVFAPTSWLGAAIEHVFGVRLLFSFTGLVVGSVLFGLPFMIPTIVNGLDSIDRSIIEASLTQGANRVMSLLKIELPMIRSSIITAIALTFAHTMGEFGLVLMIGGNLPGITRVGSIAIYTEMAALDYHAASMYALVLLAISFVMIFFVKVVSAEC